MSSFGNGIHNAGGPGSSAEPSMEEILASIRRILKEDEGSRGPSTSPRPDDNDDLLVLDGSMMATDAEAKKHAARESFIEAAMREEPEVVHFTSNPAFFAAPPPPPPAPEPELVLYSEEPEEELLLTSDEPEEELLLTSDEPEEELLLTADEPEPELMLHTLAPEPEPEMLLSAPEPAAKPAWEAAYEPVTAAAPEPEPVIYTAAPAPAPLPEPEPVLFMAPAAPVAAPPEIMEPAPMPAAAAPTETSLLDDKLANVISDSIGSMMRSATAERSVGVGRSGVTLEDIVREEMKPVLKAWLETNLPDMVERVVRAEIERVVARIKA